MDWAEYQAFATLNRKLNQVIEILGGQVMPALTELEVEVDRAVAAIDAAKAKIDELVASGTVSQGQIDTLAAKLRTAVDNIMPAQPQEGQAAAEASAARAGAGEFRNR